MVDRFDYMMGRDINLFLHLSLPLCQPFFCAFFGWGEVFYLFVLLETHVYAGGMFHKIIPNLMCALP